MRSTGRPVSRERLREAHGVRLADVLAELGDLAISVPHIKGLGGVVQITGLEHDLADAAGDGVGLDAVEQRCGDAPAPRVRVHEHALQLAAGRGRGIRSLVGISRGSLDDERRDAHRAVAVAGDVERDLGALERREVEQEVALGRVEALRVGSAAVEQALDLGLAWRFDGDGDGCCGHAPSVRRACCAGITKRVRGFPSRFPVSWPSRFWTPRMSRGWVCESKGPVSGQSPSNSHRM